MVLLHNFWETASRRCELQTSRARQLAMHLLISTEKVLSIGITKSRMAIKEQPILLITLCKLVITNY